MNSVNKILWVSISAFHIFRLSKNWTTEVWIVFLFRIYSCSIISGVFQRFLVFFCSQYQIYITEPRSCSDHTRLHTSLLLPIIHVLNLRENYLYFYILKNTLITVCQFLRILLCWTFMLLIASCGIKYPGSLVKQNVVTDLNKYSGQI